MQNAENSFINTFVYLLTKLSQAITMLKYSN